MPTDVVSNTQLKCFKRCKRKYWLSFVRKLKPVYYAHSGARQLGTRVHGALEMYYANEGDAGRIAARTYLDELLAQDLTELTPYENEEDVRKDHDMALTIVDGYFDWLVEEGADADLEVVGIEQVLRTPSPVDGVDLIGKLDLVMRNRASDQTGLMDHKTTMDLQTPLKTLGMDEQFRMYALMQRSAGGTPLHFQLYNMLKKSKRTARAKPPFFARYPVYISDDELRTFWDRLYGEILDIVRFEELMEAHPADHQRIAYPTPMPDCSWSCDYFSVCPLFDSPRSDPEHVLAMNYAPGDPHEHYEGKLQ